MTTNIEELQNELQAKKICRFCLSQQEDKLQSLHTRLQKSSAPLPVQVMACASIEVFSNDGMPSWVCTDCRVLFEHSYRFKQMCKRAETLLRQFPLTGQWPSPLAKPRVPREIQSTPLQQPASPALPTVKTIPMQTQTPTLKVQQNTTNPRQYHNPSVGAKLPTTLTATRPKILLNSNPVASPEPPVPIRMKKEKVEDETSLFLTKVENNEELSMDDVQRLIAANDNDDGEEFVNSSPPELIVSPRKTSSQKPKLLNKSSMRILNKEADIVLEPRLSEPQVKRDEDGNVAIVTEILDPNVPYESEPDPIKNAEPVETNVFPCPHCDRSYPLRQLRDIHMVNHNRQRSFQCGDCDKSFFSKYDLQKHNLIHTGDRPYKCTVCSKTFTRATLLHRHEKTHTDIPKFICIYCEKPFISKDEMEKHSERHRKNRPFQCKVCKKCFAFKQGLERHEVVHSRDQPYPCQYCNLSFSTPSKLQRHLTAHAGSRPYPCKFCPKSYLLSHHLTRHLRSHKMSDTVSFSCTECKKIYKTCDELIYHSAVHATETLVCPLCKTKFDSVDTATAHVHEHANGDAYACEFCDLIFIHADGLRKHCELEHMDEMAVYLEDENAQTQNADEQQSSLDMENVNNDLQQTIDDFLIEELPQTVETSIKPIIKKQEVINPKQQPHILKQVVLQSVKINESYTMPDDNIAVVNEAEQLTCDEDEEMIPPAKIRKTFSNSKQAVEPTKQQTPPQLKRKIVTAASVTQQLKPNPIKIEKKEALTVASVEQKLKQPSINSMLKALPKGVSVRRNVPIAKTQPEKMAATTPSPQRVLRAATRRSNEVDGLSEEQDVKPLLPNNLSSIKNSLSNKILTTSSSSVEKPVEKKPKYQKITITKAAAAAMAKEGRIRIKDGNMILTQKPSK